MCEWVQVRICIFNAHTHTHTHTHAHTHTHTVHIHIHIHIHKRIDTHIDMRTQITMRTPLILTNIYNRAMSDLYRWVWALSESKKRRSACASHTGRRVHDMRWSKRMTGVLPSLNKDPSTFHIYLKNKNSSTSAGSVSGYLGGGWLGVAHL
jgi:hypothetical protein